MPSEKFVIFSPHTEILSRYLQPDLRFATKNKFCLIPIIGIFG